MASTAVEDAAVKAVGGLATAGAVPVLKVVHRWFKKRHLAAEAQRRAEIREEALVAVKPLQEAFEAHKTEDAHCFRMLLVAVQQLNQTSEIIAADTAWMRDRYNGEPHARREEK